MDAIKIYTEQMAKRMRGTALYEPKWEVYIGDVGYFRSGRFFRLFNITLPRHHQLQRKGVPNSFVQFDAEQLLRNAEPDFFQPQALHSESVWKNEINVELEGDVVPAGAGIEFRCNNTHGAVLILRSRMGREDVEDSPVVREYIRKHIDSWYNFARGPACNARVDEGELVLVRGCDKTASWALAVFQSRSTEVGTFFKGGYVTIGGARVAVKGSWSSGTASECREGPGSSFSAPRELPISESERNPDLYLPPEQHQCIFVRVWKARRLRLPLGIPPRIRAAAEPPNPPQDRTDFGSAAVPADLEPVVEIELDPGETTVRDPLDALLDYMTAHCPTAKLLIATDDDLYSICRGNTLPDDVAALIRTASLDLHMDANGTCTVHHRPKTVGDAGTNNQNIGDRGVQLVPLVQTVAPSHPGMLARTGSYHLNPSSPRVVFPRPHPGSSMDSISLETGAAPVPGLESAFTLVQASMKRVENVKVYRQNCQELNRQCLALLVALNEQMMDMDGTLIQGVADQAKLAIKRIHRRIERWAGYNSLQSILKQGDIKTEIDSSYHELDSCMGHFNLAVTIDQSQRQRTMSAIQQRDQTEFMDMLQGLAADVAQLKHLAEQNIMEFPALMQSVREGLHSLPLSPTQMRDSRKILRELRKETALLLPPADLTGQITEISEHAVAFGSSSDIHVGTWLDDEKVALKRHHSFNSSEQAQRRLLRDVERWRPLQHKNILPLYGTVFFGNRVSLVSPWMDNGSAGTYLKDHPELPRVPLLRKIASGLDYLHSKMVIHGDIRGNNVLLDSNLNPYIVDFGLSQILEEIIGSQSIVIPNSFRWTSPELIQPALIGAETTPYSAQTDAWSFGMLCLELLTNARPFSQMRNDSSVSQALVDGHLPSRPEQVPELSDELWELMNECWQRIPASRPSLHEVKEVLTRLDRTTRGSNLLPQSDPEFDEAAAMSTRQAPSPPEALTKRPMTSPASTNVTPPTVMRRYYANSWAPSVASSSSSLPQAESRDPRRFSQNSFASSILTLPAMSFDRTTLESEVLEEPADVDWLDWHRTEESEPWQIDAGIIHSVKRGYQPPTSTPLEDPSHIKQTTSDFSAPSLEVAQTSPKRERGFTILDMPLKKDKSHRDKGKGKEKEEKDKGTSTGTWPLPQSPPLALPVFGAPLLESLRYAGVEVPIVLHGRHPVYTSIPVCVAKCGSWLKRFALDEVGVFRKPGSDRRMKQLVRIFETPPDYGRKLDMKGDFSIADAAGVLRKFLNELPEPVVPPDFYLRFIALLDITDEARCITTCVSILEEMPPSNCELLLYMLDLFSIFAQHSAANLMTVQDLVGLFQTSLLIHPDRVLKGEMERCRQVLEFMTDRLKSLLDARSAPEEA